MTAEPFSHFPRIHSISRIFIRVLVVCPVNTGTYIPPHRNKERFFLQQISTVIFHEPYLKKALQVCRAEYTIYLFHFHQAAVFDGHGHAVLYIV